MSKEDDNKEASERSRRFAWCDDDVKGLKIIKSKNIASPPAEEAKAKAEKDEDEE